MSEDTNRIDWRDEDSSGVPGERARGLHPLQAGYLVAGLLAIGAAVLWLLAEQDLVTFGDGSIALSVVLIVSGAVGLVASLGRALRR